MESGPATSYTLVAEFSGCSHHIGSKPIRANPLITLGKSDTPRYLDNLYLQPGKPVDPEARLRAVNAYMADLLVDTGELDLTLGRTPGERGKSDPEKIGTVELS